jgi:hypothetical protein
LAVDEVRRRDWLGAAQKEAVTSLPAKPPPAKEAAEKEEDDMAPGDAWRSLRGERHALHLVFVFRDGEDFSMPYALLPTTWSGAGGSFLIEYPQLTVWLRGRNLADLKQAVRRHQITQVREVDMMQAAALPCVVTSIEIVDWFPSREVAAIGRVTGLWSKSSGNQEGEGQRTPRRERAEA